MTLTGRRGAPRLVFKILGVSFAVIVTVLAVVFLMLSWQTRDRLSRAILANVEASQLRFAELEDQRQVERRAQAAALAESPTLKAAVDTYYAERGLGGPRDQLLDTIRGELVKLGQTIGVPAIAVTDVSGRILASTGPRASDWLRGGRVAPPEQATGDTTESVLVRGATPYLATVVPLAIGPDIVGDLVLARPIDDAYARQIQRDAGPDVVIFHHGRLVAATVGPPLRATLSRLALPERGSVSVDDEDFAAQRLRAIDDGGIYAIASVSAPVWAATREAAGVFLVTALGALVLAAAASWWLAHTLATPIDRLRKTLAQMAEARDFERRLMPDGASVELDALTETFDQLRSAVAAAEAESEATYLGVIGALAAALDARDPYTAGHSTRVAHLAVEVGRQMGLGAADLDVLRLGALLHDIGKIGVSDAVLRKPGTLNDDELDQIRRHPTLGARILRPLNFLSEHLAIVELHHEQPDGRGYPHGLHGDETPLFARIVHVADAFDAMTTARAYRPGRPATEAMAELWKYAGTSFDLEVVQALAAVPATVLLKPAAPHAPAELEAGAPSLAGSLVPFRLRAAGGDRVRRSTA